MNPIVEKLLIWILDKLLTPDLIYKEKETFVAFLKDLASKSDSGIDDELVKLVALALGVPYN